MAAESVQAPEKTHRVQAPLGQTQQLLGTWSLGTVVFAVASVYEAEKDVGRLPRAELGLVT